jgi:hypothetical protein
LHGSDPWPSFETHRVRDAPQDEVGPQAVAPQNLVVQDRNQERSQAGGLDGGVLATKRRIVSRLEASRKCLTSIC